jgi:hypothetical protein
MYVWVDALTNYITGVGYPDTDSEKFKKYWPADLHVIGKDIVRFHAVYWPAFLMSAGIAVPKRIFSHGFLFNRGEKMSKSVGNVIDPFALADAYGVDQLRYFFLREVPFGQDGNYSHEAIVNRINADLANDLGNLAQRSLTMVAQLGGVNCRAGRVQRQRSGDPERRRRHDRQGARRDGDAAASSGAQCGLGRGRRGQPLFRRRSAVGAGQDRSGAAGHGALRDRRSDAADRHPGAAFMPASAGKLLDLLAVPEASAVFSFSAASTASRRRKSCRRRRRCSRATSSRRARNGMQRHADRQPLPSRFSRFRHELDAVVARARAAGIARMVTISTRVPLAALLAIAERFPTSIARSARIRITPMKRLDHRPPIWSAARGIPRSSRLAKPGSIITTTTRRARRRSAASAPTSPPRARPGCRWSFIPARPTTTPRAFSKKKQGRGLPAVLHCFTGGPSWRAGPSRSGSSSLSPAF